MSSSASGTLAPEYADWRRRVEQELGGASFEETLRSGSPEGVVREPLYTRADLPGPAAPLPGTAPFTRGRLASRGFRIAREHRLGDAAAAQAALVSGVESGVGLAWLRLMAPLSAEDAATLLDGVDLGRLDIVLEGPGAASSATAFAGAAKHFGFAARDLRGGFGCDPLGTRRLESDFPAAVAVFASSRRRFPGMRALLVSTEPYHEAGASAVEELAFAAATGLEYLRYFSNEGWTAADAAAETLFSLHTCGDFFLDVAKLRAARLLWAKVVRATTGSDSAMAVHARPSVRSRRVGDPWDHLLHTSAESFAAVAGGAESVVAASHPQRDDGGRLGVSALHVLREEAHLARVADPAGGSYYVERLTDEIARAAWKLCQEIEAGGGMARALDEGRIDEIVAATAAKRQEGAAP